MWRSVTGGIYRAVLASVFVNGASSSEAWVRVDLTRAVLETECAEVIRSTNGQREVLSASGRT